MPDGIPRVRGPAIAREISQIGVPESPARRGGAGVLEALRETFALSPAVREIRARDISARRALRGQAIERERERQIPVGPAASAALGLLFQTALTARGVPTEEAARQAEERTRGLTRGQIETVQDALSAVVRQDPQGAERAQRVLLTARGQLTQQIGRLDDDVRMAGVLVGQAFTAENEARRQRLVRERADLQIRLQAFDQLNRAIFGIPISGIRGAEPQPARGRVQVREPAQSGPAQPTVTPAPTTTQAEQEFLGGL